MRCTYSYALLAAGLVSAFAIVANAASSLSNPLTGFSGDTSQAPTQAQLAAAGFSVFSTSGETINDSGTPDNPLDDFVDSNPAVVLDGNGAHFGSLFQGDGGRNYMRTIESDYATVPFVAEITYEIANDDQQVFFGLGAGDTALFGLPDWSTLFSSASFWPETAGDKIVSFRTENDNNAFVDTNVPGYDPGIHRIRMTFDPVLNHLRAFIDLNYAGGPFVADAQTAFPIVTTSLFGPDGWPSEPSRIFFGGDDGAILRDLAINVIPEPASFALLSLGAMMLVRAVRGRRDWM